MNELADQSLLELVRDGDERAFEVLVLRYGRPLRSYCMRLGVPAHSTEDVVQQALLEAWLALRGGAQVHAFKAWLYRVVHNIALDAVRKNPRVTELASGEAEQAAAPMPSEMLRSDLQETLSAVASLPLLQREAIVRTALAGESHEQAGRYLGLTASAVRGLVYRGRATLRSALAALVPPWLPRLLASRSSASSGLRESLSGIATGAGSTGSAGVLVKAGVIMAVAATAITATMPGHTARTGTDRPARRAPATAATYGSSLAPEAGRRSNRPQGSGNPRAHAAVASDAAGPTPTRNKSISRSPTVTHGAGSQPAASGPATGSTGTGQAQTGQSPASGATGPPAEASSAGASSSQPAGGGASAPTEVPSGSGTQPAGGSGSSGSEQSEPPSGSSGSSSSEGGGLVGEVVHTVEKTLETTLEDTLGGLLHH